jgi:cell division protein FtsB
LESFNLFPVKENRKTAFYFALDREEKIPSLSVDFVKNKAFDFGTGKSYDVISIVQQMNQCSVSEALKYLEKFDFSVQNEFHNEEPMQQKEVTRKLEIRNAGLDAEVRDLKQGYDAIEERARFELGMIKQDETFVQIPEKVPGK